MESNSVIIRVITKSKFFMNLMTRIEMSNIIMHICEREISLISFSVVHFLHNTGIGH